MFKPITLNNENENDEENNEEQTKSFIDGHKKGHIFIYMGIYKKIESYPSRGACFDNLATIDNSLLLHIYKLVYITKLLINFTSTKFL